MHRSGVRSERVPHAHDHARLRSARRRSAARRAVADADRGPAIVVDVARRRVERGATRSSLPSGPSRWPDPRCPSPLCGRFAPPRDLTQLASVPRRWCRSLRTRPAKAPAPPRNLSNAAATPREAVWYFNIANHSRQAPASVSPGLLVPPELAFPKRRCSEQITLSARTCAISLREGTCNQELTKRRTNSSTSSCA